MKFLIALFLLAITFRIDLIKIKNERLQKYQIPAQKEASNYISQNIRSRLATEEEIFESTKSANKILFKNGILQSQKFTGKVSIYSENGCLDCKVHYSASGSAYSKTASGDIFEDSLFTIAHKTIALGSRVKLTNLNNGKMIEAIVNDKGPYAAGRIADLTPAVANALGIRTDELVGIEVIK